VKRRDFLKILGISPVAPKLGLDVLARVPKPWYMMNLPFLTNATAWWLVRYDSEYETRADTEICISLDRKRSTLTETE
jgi:hypothetical protein